MKIEHIAIWVSDLEKMRSFYEMYFDGKSGDQYYNPVKQFSSYFISFSSGSRLELMHRPDISEKLKEGAEHIGLTHFAISIGSKHAVDNLTQRLSSDGYQVVGPPRTTGDGYYESVVLDPEQNRIELTI